MPAEALPLPSSISGNEELERSCGRYRAKELGPIEEIYEWSCSPVTSNFGRELAKS
jgi:hypothetical protein